MFRYRIKRQIANMITSIRILCSFLLLFCPPLSIPFYIIYIIAGVSDMIDGTVARKTGTVSELGSNLDTIADFIFVLVCLIKIIPILNIENWMYFFIVFIVIIKITNIILGFITQKKLVSVHSITNKILGALLFALPFTLSAISLRYTVTIICSFALFAAMQEGYIIIKHKNK